jgi:hypothetical protein
MNTEKFAQLSEIFKKQLHICVEKKPRAYFWYTDDISRIDEIADMCMQALSRGNFNISDSLALKYACKELGIKHTRKAIHAFLELPDRPSYTTS